MRPDEQDALEALTLRLRHVEATASLLSFVLSDKPDECDTLGGVAATIREIAERIDRMATAD